MVKTFEIMLILVAVYAYVYIDIEIDVHLSEKNSASLCRKI